MAETIYLRQLTGENPMLERANGSALVSIQERLLEEFWSSFARNAFRC
nr:hypothetical protein [Mycobacterium lepromatosis]